MKTRVEAFLEMLTARVISKGEFMITVGMDLGTQKVKAVVLKDDAVVVKRASVFRVRPHQSRRSKQ